MMTVATDDVFPDAAGGVGRGRERPRSRTALPELHVLLEPVCAGKDMVTVRWTAHGAHRGDSEMVWHRLGECGKHRSRFPRRGSW
jgi:hypothetical protein